MEDREFRIVREIGRINAVLSALEYQQKVVRESTRLIGETYSNRVDKASALIQDAWINLIDARTYLYSLRKEWSKEGR